MARAGKMKIRCLDPGQVEPENLVVGTGKQIVLYP